MEQGKNSATVIEAMRSIQTESDRWRLAEVLAQQIPSGEQGFDKIIDEATAAGVDGGLKANTLRLYRDAANRWPADKRVPNVSFSAHREAMVLPGGIAPAAKMLADLSKNLGAGKVTVQSVRKAVRVQQGKAAPAASTNGATTSNRAAVDVLADVMAGSPQLIAAISPTTRPHELDKLYSGLNKAIAHVDRLRAKAARKTQAVKKAAAKPATAAPRKPAARKSQGDLRGL